MALEDKIKWDKKYTKTPKLLDPRPPSVKLQNFLKQIEKGKALDLACGSGRNAIFLSDHGFDVTACDISSIALDTLKSRDKTIKTNLIDLEGYKPSKESFNLIVITNYLDRQLYLDCIEALKPNGILFIETYMEHQKNTKKDSNPDFLLKKSELKNLFSHLQVEILDYDEFENEAHELHRMYKQSIMIKQL